MTTIRPVRADDLPLLTLIEDAADRMFAERFGGVAWPEATSGEERAAEPGFVLVAGDPAIGFAHVLVLEGYWHLEQVSVLPEHGRRGVGSALLEAAVAEVQRRGGREVTLRTYADVPWNGPWYARHGWVEVEPPDFHAPLVEDEDRFEMARHGHRISMRRVLPWSGATGV